MYHRFLIHLFTDGHLGCFQHLAIVNCTAMNIRVTKLFYPLEIFLAVIYSEYSPHSLEKCHGMQNGRSKNEENHEAER